MRSQIYALGLSVVASLAFVTVASAQDFPSRGATIVAPVGPGGAVDLVTRFVADGLSKKWGQPVVVENREGAGSQVGTAFVANAPGDGYTMLVVSPSFATQPAMTAELPYDAKADLKPVALIGETSFLLAAGPNVQAETLTELLDESRSRDVYYAAIGAGSITHLAAELVNQAAGTNMQFVSYRSGSDALVDVVGGRADIYIGSALTMLPFLEDGKLRVLAVLGQEPMPLLPDVPTVSEAGLTGAESGTWWGLLVPGDTPDAVVERINADVREIMASPEAEEFLNKQQARPGTLTASEFQAFVATEMDRWTKLVAERNLQAE